MSTLRRSLTSGSPPQTNCVTIRHGAWMDTIGMS